MFRIRIDWTLPDPDPDLIRIRIDLTLLDPKPDPAITLIVIFYFSETNAAESPRCVGTGFDHDISQKAKNGNHTRRTDQQNKLSRQKKSKYE
jgi:hypothetical protein